MIVFARSTWCSRSQMILYWLMGTSSEVSWGIQSSSHSCLTAATSAATSSSVCLPAPPVRALTSATSAARASRASPSSGKSTLTSLLMSPGLEVLWMTVLPGGTAMP